MRDDNSLMTNPTWEDVEIRGWTGVEGGFVHTARTRWGLDSVDQNDEHANYAGITAYALEGSPFVLAHSQCKEIRIERCNRGNCGRYGVDATGAGYWGIVGREAEPRHRGASFSAVACRGGYSGIAEYALFPVVQERVGRDQATAPRYLRVRGNLYRSSGEKGDWPVARFEVEQLVEGQR